MSTGEHELHNVDDVHGVNETTDVSFPKFSLAELKKFKAADLKQLYGLAV